MIIEDAVQFLSEDRDASSLIKISTYDGYFSNRVHISCDYELSRRLIHNNLKKYGALQSLKPCGYGNYQWIAAFEEEKGKGKTN